MHRLILTDNDKRLIREVYAVVRRAPPPPSAESKRLTTKARSTVTALTKKPPRSAHEPESPELVVALHALLSPLLKRQVRWGAPRVPKQPPLGGAPGTGTTLTEPLDDDLAQLAVALYLAYELIHEFKLHGDHDHPA